MNSDKSNASHSERSRGIPRQHRQAIPRGPSTPLRSAQDDNATTVLCDRFVIRHLETCLHRAK